MPFSHTVQLFRPRDARATHGSWRATATDDALVVGRAAVGDAALQTRIPSAQCHNQSPYQDLVRRAARRVQSGYCWLEAALAPIRAERPAYPGSGVPPTAWLTFAPDAGGTMPDVRSVLGMAQRSLPGLTVTEDGTSVVLAGAAGEGGSVALPGPEGAPPMTLALALSATDLDARVAAAVAAVALAHPERFWLHSGSWPVWDAQPVEAAETVLIEAGLSRSAWRALASDALIPDPPPAAYSKEGLANGPIWFV